MLQTRRHDPLNQHLGSIETLFKANFTRLAKENRDLGPT